MSIESRKPALYKGNAPRERSTCTITATNSPISCYVMRVAVGCAERTPSELARSFVWERLICDGSNFYLNFVFVGFFEHR